MDRRTFLTGVPLTAASLRFPSSGRLARVPASNGQTTVWPLVPPGVRYFTRQRMESLIDTSVSVAGIPFQVMVYNFPSWHPSPLMEKTFGTGWTEFEAVRHAKPWFDGEVQPKIRLSR